MSDTLSSGAVHEAEGAAAAPAGTLSLTTRVGVASVQPTQIVFEYSTLPGNNPNRYGNAVFLWQTSSEVIPGTVPLASVAIAGNQPDGTGAVTGLAIGPQPYLLGYATGPRVQNICATVFIPAGGGSQAQTPGIDLTGLSPDSIAYAYDLPAGTQPSAQGHWVGLWQGGAGSALYSVQPLAFAPVPLNVSSGRGILQNLRLLRGMQYTLACFAGGYDATRPGQTTPACCTSFTT